MENRILEGNYNNDTVVNIFFSVPVSLDSPVQVGRDAQHKSINE